MTTEPQILSYLGSSALVALLAAAILWRRQAKQRIRLGFLPVAVTYLIVVSVCAALILGLAALNTAEGLSNGKWVVQLLWVVSGVVAYFVGGQVIVRLRGSGG